LTSELDKLISILNTQSLIPYKIASKWKFSSFMTAHLDDFTAYTFKGYGTPSLRNYFQAEFDHSERIWEEIKKLRKSSRGLIGFYARDDTWDSLIKHTDAYLESNRYRNPQKSNAVECVESLLELGFAVIRLGRSSESFFDSPRNNFFDYASDSALWADRLDFLLWREVDFGFVTNGGACQPALFFGKPFIIWDYAESIEGVTEMIPNYERGKVILIPRVNRNGMNLSGLVHHKEFLETACSALITKSSEISGTIHVKNILVYEKIF
jgi:putative glycosyltransferase (TIGR04372 family)